MFQPEPIPQHLLDIWHPTKNLPLTPDNFHSKSKKTVWWLGECGHEWDGGIAWTGKCVYCSNKRFLPGFNDLATVEPELAKEWHPTKNGKTKPNQIIASKKEVYWWLGECGHEWDTNLKNRRDGCGCPYCAGQKILFGFNDLLTKNPELASEWHPTKNGKLSPSQVPVSHNEYVWWLGKCGHEWDAPPGRRNQDIGCPYCCGQKVAEGINDITTTHPEIAHEWNFHKNGDLLPTQISKGYHKTVWWICEKGHEWPSKLGTRVAGSGCPHCARKRLTVGENDLQTIAPEVALEWHPTKNGIAPHEVVATKLDDFWWLGPCGHEWQASVSNRVYGKTQCPNCSSRQVTSKVEKEIAAFLSSAGLLIIENDRAVLGGKEIDILLPSGSIGVEYNGSYWHSTNRKDKDSHFKKYSLAKTRGIQLIQIWEADWKIESKNIQAKLLHTVTRSNPQKLPARISVQDKNSQLTLTINDENFKLRTFSKQTYKEIWLPNAKFILDDLVVKAFKDYCSSIVQTKKVRIVMDNCWPTDFRVLVDAGFEIAEEYPPQSRTLKDGLVLYDAGYTGFDLIF